MADLDLVKALRGYQAPQGNIAQPHCGAYVDDVAQVSARLDVATAALTAVYMAGGLDDAQYKAAWNTVQNNFKGRFDAARKGHRPLPAGDVFDVSRKAYAFTP